MKNRSLHTAFAIASAAFVYFFASTPVYAFEIKNEAQFITRLAAVFNLNESQVRAFIDLYKSTETQTYEHAVPTAKPMPNEQANDGRNYTGKLAFIDAKLSDAVNSNTISKNQKTLVMKKIEELMPSAPTTKQFLAMTKSEQQHAIDAWKKKMDNWARNNGLTLEQIRQMTGKGNKYLMGIQF